MRVVLNEERPPQAMYIQVQDLIIAGWTGRDAAAIEQHIEELESIGVARPKRMPMFYRVSADRLTTQETVDVIGRDSTGEAEFVLLQKGRSLFVGLGSDHTDRKAESFGVTLSKQLCPKPIAAELWRWKDVEPHWNDLKLRCTVHTGEVEVLYQEGPVTAMLHPRVLLRRYAKETGTKLAPGTAMFCGTLAAKNKITWAESYRLELCDPVLKRSLTHFYRVRALPVVD
jgi:hypothetical protein